jgi:hypothetical protein
MKLLSLASLAFCWRAAVFGSLPERIDKAQIRGVLRQLEEDYESLRSWPSGDSAGGRFTFAGSHDKWKLTFHLIQMEE